MPSSNHSLSTVAVNLPGGIVPAGDMLAILAAAEAAGVEQVQFGHRQQLLLAVEPARCKALLQALNSANVLGESEELQQIGKYLADKLNPSTSLGLAVKSTTKAPKAGNIYLTLSESDTLGEEGYELTVTEDLVTFSHRLV